MALTGTGADGPDGLIGYDALLDLAGVHPRKGGLDLVGDELHGELVLALLEALAHADDGGDAGGEQGLGLGVHEGVALGVVLAALTVADDAVLDTQVGQHGGADLAGVGAGLVRGDVLRTEGEAAVAHDLGHGGDDREGHAEHALAGLGLGHSRAQLLDEGL